MTLNPEEYRGMIGVARTDAGSVVVYPDRLVAESPPELAGRPLSVRDGMVYEDCGLPFPPWKLMRIHYKHDTEVSKRLAQEIIRMRIDYGRGVGR